MFEDVEDTALWVAAFRARESARPDALFRDTLASRLADERGRQLARDVTGARQFEWSIAVRTRVIDELILFEVQRGIDTVLNLGAGMDARPYRLGIPQGTRWIEADQPKIIDLKERRLAGERPVCRLERFKVDLAEADERRSFLSSIEGRVLVLTEGVIGYLENAQVESLARELHDRPGIERWIVDRSSRLLRDAMARRRAVRRDFRNASFRFDPGDWERFFEETGWTPTTMRYLVEEGERFGRPVPLPVFFRLLMPFMTRARKTEVRQMLGIAALARS